MDPRGSSGTGSHSRILQQSTLPNKEEYKLVDYKSRYAIKSNYFGARFIFECGVKLDATPITIATSANMFHRFFKEVDIQKYDIYLIGASCLYLAGKVENQHLRIRDIINVAYATIHRNNPPLEYGEPYLAFRDAIFQTELLMMRILKFKITFEHPHKFLTHYLKSIEDWIGQDEASKKPVARTAWAILQDFHHDPAVVGYPPEALAVASIQLALQIYEIKVPLCSAEGRNSWQNIVYPEIQADIQTEIMLKMLRVYETDDESMPSVAIKQENINGK